MLSTSETKQHAQQEHSAANKQRHQPNRHKLKLLVQVMNVFL
jgi:hypothetical protein